MTFSHNNFLANIASIDNFKNLSLSVNNWVDFLVITILIYIVIRVLSETHSLSIAIGILGLSVLYATSTVFNLPLTRLILQGFFGILLIFITIIFQKEFRRLFSFVGFFNFRKHAQPTETTIATIAHSVAHLSKTKTGALIVFPGKESIARMLSGGIILNGHISEEFIISIFDESTPGHDGAVIIEDNIIKKFAVHLPLAENLEQLGKLGLRHRAAIGLSERSDAFIIVVSGESGRIDIARNGAFEQCADENVVREKLSEFYKTIVSKSRWTYFFQWTSRNMLSFVTAFIIAFIIWLFFVPDFTLIQKKFTVPLEFQNIPSSYVIQNAIPYNAVVTIQGQNLNFGSLTPQSIEVYADLSSVTKPGWHEITLTPDNISVPINFSPVTITPKTIEVEIVKKN
jgi:uncharacterized protein (TIGR00159 family)